MGTAAMEVERAREALSSGKRIRIVVGAEAEDPTIVLSLDDGMVMSTAVAGWSAGVVEPVCGLESDFLRTYLLDRESIEIVVTGAGSSRAGDAGWAIPDEAIPDGWDRIDGQQTAQLPDGRTFAVVKGRRWTRVSEYLSNGQLTARWFVDENSGEAREADGWRKAKRWPMAAGAQEFARWVVTLAHDPSGGLA